MKQNNKILNTILLALLFVMAFVPVSQAMTIDSVNEFIATQVYNVTDTASNVIGSYVDAYNCQYAYCVYHPWYSPSLTKAKNGSSGWVENTSTSADVVGQYAINASAGKGCMYIRTGKYENVSWVIYQNGTCILGEVKPGIVQDAYNGAVLYQNANDDPVISTPANVVPINGTRIKSILIYKRTSFTAPVLDLVDVAYSDISDIMMVGYGRIRTSSCSASLYCSLGTFKNSKIFGYIVHDQTDWIYDGVSFSFASPGYAALLTIGGTATRVTNSYFFSGWKIPAILVTNNQVQNIITNNQFDQVGNTFAVKLESTIGSGRNVVANNMFFETNGTALVISSSNNMIIGNQFYRTGYGRGHNYSGDIVLIKGGATEVKYNVISGNSFYGENSERTKYAIYEYTGGEIGVVEYNSFTHNAINPIGYPVAAYNYSNWSASTKSYSKGNVALDANINQTY